MRIRSTVFVLHTINIHFIILSHKLKDSDYEEKLKYIYYNEATSVNYYTNLNNSKFIEEINNSIILIFQQLLQFLI